MLLRPLGVAITEARYFLGRALTPDSPAVSGLRSATPPRLWRSVGFYLSTAEGSECSIRHRDRRDVAVAAFGHPLRRSSGRRISTTPNRRFSPKWRSPVSRHRTAPNASARRGILVGVRRSW